MAEHGMIALDTWHWHGLCRCGAPLRYDRAEDGYVATDPKHPVLGMWPKPEAAEDVAEPELLGSGVQDAPESDALAPARLSRLQEALEAMGMDPEAVATLRAAQPKAPVR